MRDGWNRGWTCVFVALALLAPAGCSDDETVAPPEPCAPAKYQSPHLTLIDLDGVEYDIKRDLCESMVLLDFEATWCGPCGRGVPRLQSLHEAFADGGLRVLGVDVRETDREAIRAYFADRGGTYPVLMDSMGYYAGSWGVDTVPTYILVSREGEEVFRTAGFDETRLDDLETEVRARLNHE